MITYGVVYTHNLNNKLKYHKVKAYIKLENPRKFQNSDRKATRHKFESRKSKE